LPTLKQKRRESCNQTQNLIKNCKNSAKKRRFLIKIPRVSLTRKKEKIIIISKIKGMRGIRFRKEAKNERQTKTCAEKQRKN